ncbi:MAG: hypothetical protein JO142_04020 [Burkholderiales bacterium]|nr:hypothetical protein [Burkholderiales bacterium]
MTYKNATYALTCLAAALLAACANFNQPADATGAPATTAAAPAKPSQTQASLPDDNARPAPILVGKVYERGVTTPPTIEREWTRLLAMDLGPKAERDFMLLSNKGQWLLVVAERGALIKGKNYAYTITDEMPLPQSAHEYPFARCAREHQGRHNVLAAFESVKTHTPAGAIGVNEQGRIEELTGAQIAALYCVETPRKQP